MSFRFLGMQKCIKYTAYNEYFCRMHFMIVCPAEGFARKRVSLDNSPKVWCYYRYNSLFAYICFDLLNNGF